MRRTWALVLVVVLAACSGGSDGDAVGNTCDDYRDAADELATGRTEVGDFRDAVAGFISDLEDATGADEVRSALRTALFGLDRDPDASATGTALADVFNACVGLGSNGADTLYP